MPVVLLSSSSSSSSSVTSQASVDLFWPRLIDSSKVFQDIIHLVRNSTLFLAFVFYGCEYWSFTLRDEHRLRVLKNRVLRNIFGSSMDEVEEWRRLHNEELYDLLSTPNIKSRRLRCVGHVLRVGDRTGAYRVWWAVLKKRDHLEHQDSDGSMILKLIFKM